MMALTLVHLKGALDIANLRRWRQACVMVHANRFSQDYPGPDAIVATIDALIDAFDEFNRATEKESTIELADDADTFPSLISDTIDELIKERDGAIDDEEEARADLAKAEEERDEAIKERDEAKAEHEAEKARADRAMTDIVEVIKERDHLRKQVLAIWSIVEGSREP